MLDRHRLSLSCCAFALAQTVFRLRLPALPPLPALCAGCGVLSPTPLCATCFERMHDALLPRAAAGALCQICAQPLATPGARCSACLRRPPAWTQGHAAVPFTPPFDAWVHALKFGHQLHWVPIMVDCLRDALLLAPPCALPDLLCPVPLSPGRLAMRGFNPAWELARRLGAQLGVPAAAQLLLRPAAHTPQSLRTRAERLRALRGAFIVPPAALGQIEGRHLGVVDDVLTTGATLEEAARTLRAHGAAQVSVLVFARTPDGMGK